MNEAQRGKEAARLLDDPLLKEAFEEIEKYQISRWRHSTDDDEGWTSRSNAHDCLRGLDLFKDQLVSFVITGRMAETKTNRPKD
jgi:hypothetical protein